MYYTPFLILQSQLLDQKKAKLIVEGIEIYFQVHLEEDKWILKAKLYVPLESLTSYLEETLSSLDYVNLGKGAAMKAYPEEGFVVLTHISESSKSFLHFRGLIKDFMSNYDLWKSVIDDMVKSEGLLLT
jgi:hypothetical protein